MKIRDYLATRLAFIIAHLLAGALCIAVIQLDLLQTGEAGLTRGSSIYIAVLHLAILFVVLAVDYSGQNPFYRRMREISDAPDTLDRVPSLPKGKTAEQRIAGELAHSAYSHYTSEVLARDERSQFHIDFTNRWAHAMKTPVSVIDLLVQQSRETISLEEAHAFFESIQEENERIAHGLDMMLGVARQERFSVDLFPEQVNLAELAREVINKHKKEFIRYSIYPKVEVSAGSPYVETDKKWIAFVIDQLISNAIKYTKISPSDDDRKLLIRIDNCAGTDARTDTNSNVHGIMLTVKDYGVGIPEHDLPRIFDPFFTGENGRLAPESTGMGLFLANRICRELGHALSAQSEQRYGTAMTIAFSTKAITSGVTVK
jgi:signal transduction histidine kinase